MGRLSYEGERHEGALVYRDDRNEVAMTIEKQQAFDHRQELIYRNSLDLVVHMRRHNEGVEGFTHNHALEWLRDEFGERRAAGAVVAHREQAVLDYFERRLEEREPARELVHGRPDDPWRGPRGGVEEHDRGGGPERGEGGHGFER